MQIDARYQPEVHPEIEEKTRKMLRQQKSLFESNAEGGGGRGGGPYFIGTVYQYFLFLNFDSGN